MDCKSAGNLFCLFDSVVFTRRKIISLVITMVYPDHASSLQQCWLSVLTSHSIQSEHQHYCRREHDLDAQWYLWEKFSFSCWTLWSKSKELSRNCSRQNRVEVIWTLSGRKWISVRMPLKKPFWRKHTLYSLCFTPICVLFSFIFLIHF